MGASAPLSWGLWRKLSTLPTRGGGRRPCGPEGEGTAGGGAGAWDAPVVPAEAGTRALARRSPCGRRPPSFLRRQEPAL